MTVRGRRMGDPPRRIEVFLMARTPADNIMKTAVVQILHPWEKQGLIGVLTRMSCL